MTFRKIILQNDNPIDIKLPRQEPLLTDWLTAIGTIGAVIVSLYLSSKRIKLYCVGKVIMEQTKQQKGYTIYIRENKITIANKGERQLIPKYYRIYYYGWMWGNIDGGYNSRRFGLFSRIRNVCQSGPIPDEHFSTQEDGTFQITKSPFLQRGFIMNPDDTAAQIFNVKQFENEKYYLDVIDQYGITHTLKNVVIIKTTD